MRVISRKEMMQMPDGTVFSYFGKHGPIEGLYIKSGDYAKGDVDFCFSDAIGCVGGDSTGDYDNALSRLENGESVPMVVNNPGREGLFDEHLQYAVYEIDDLIDLAEELVECIRKMNNRRA